MNIFEPEIDQPPFLRVARVATEAASEPVPGSVSPKQPEPLAGAELRQELLLLLLGAPLLDRARDQRGLHRHDRARGRVAAADLLHDEAVADVVEAAPAVLLGDGRAEVAHLGDALHQLEVEALVAVVVARARDDLAVGEVARGLADQPLLVGEVEVQRAFVAERAGDLGLDVLGQQAGDPLRHRARAVELEPVERRDALHLAQRRGEEHLRSRRARRRACSSRPRTGTSRMMRSRVIDASTPASSSGVCRLPSPSTQKIVEVGASSTIAARGCTSSASLAPWRWAIRVARMLPP